MIQTQWKIPFAVVPFFEYKSQQNFARTTVAQLSWHVQNFVAILYIRDEMTVKQKFPWNLYFWPHVSDPEGVEAKRIRKRLYQDIESSAFGGMRQSGGAMQMGAGFNMAAMGRGKEMIGVVW